MDTLYDLREFFFTRSQERADNSIQGSYDAGYGAGRLIYYLIADNELAKQVDPAEGMDIDLSLFGLDDQTEEQAETPTEEEEETQEANDTGIILL